MNLGADWVPKVVTVALGAYSLLSWIILLAGLGTVPLHLLPSDATLHGLKQNICKRGGEGSPGQQRPRGAPDMPVLLYCYVGVT